MGGKCSYDPNCNDGLFCDNPSGEFDGTGTCTARKGTSESCSDNTQCTSFVCSSGKCANPSDVQAAYCGG